MLRRCLDWASSSIPLNASAWGRGLQQLRQVGALLVPPPSGLESEAATLETGRSFLRAASDQVRPSSRRGGSGAKCQNIGLKEQALPAGMRCCILCRNSMEQLEPELFGSRSREISEDEFLKR